MENEDSSEKSGELTYRKLDVPIITSEALEPVVNSFLSAITDDQWTLLAADHIDLDTFIQLYDMCHEVTDVITTWILNVVEPQIQNWMSTEAAQDRNRKNRNYYTVSEDNVKASIENTFDHCFGEVIGIPQKRSNESIALMELIAAEVKKRVNQSLAGLTSSAGQSASCPQSTESNETCDSDTTQMVYQAGSILKFLLEKDTKPSKDQENLRAVTSEDCCPNKVVNIEHSSPPNLDPKEPSPMCSVPKMRSSGHHVLCSVKGLEEEASMASIDLASEEGGTSRSEEQRLNKSSGQNKNIGHNVRTFVNRKTTTSSAGQSASCPQTVGYIDSETLNDYDISEMVNCLLQPNYPDTVSSMDFSSDQGITDVEKFCLEEFCTEDTIMCPIPPDVKSFPNVNMGDMILEEFSYTSPETIGSIQQASMASIDLASQGGTSPSKEQRLNKSSRQNKSVGHKVRTFVNRKTSKVTPACDHNTSVSHSWAEDATITRPVANLKRSDSEETVVNSLSELPINSPLKTRSFEHKVRIFFSRKTSKVTPGGDLNTSEDQRSLCRVSRNNVCPDEITEVEVFHLSEDSVTPTHENGSTQSSKQPGIMRILSSTGKILLKPFTCCRSPK